MKVIIIFIMVITLLVSFFRIDFVCEKASDTFWAWFSYQMHEEDAEREEHAKRHEVVRGRDTAFIWNKHYEIWNHLGEKHFGIEIDDADDNILRTVSLYDVYKEKFYVVAKEGYAVVDGDNLCRIFLNADTEEVESKYIEYLTSYEEFSEEEQNHFQKMLKKQKNDLYK